MRPLQPVLFRPLQASSSVQLKARSAALRFRPTSVQLQWTHIRHNFDNFASPFRCNFGALRNHVGARRVTGLPVRLYFY
eukprot:8460115-Pyramimonas_sp.AAC.1